MPSCGGQGGSRLPRAAHRFSRAPQTGAAIRQEGFETQQIALWWGSQQPAPLRGGCSGFQTPLCKHVRSAWHHLGISDTVGMMEQFVLLLLATAKIKNLMFVFCSVASLRCPLRRGSLAVPVPVSAAVCIAPYANAAQLSPTEPFCFYFFSPFQSLLRALNN